MTNTATLMVKVALMVLRILMIYTELFSATAHKRQKTGLLLAFSATVLGRHSSVYP